MATTVPLAFVSIVCPLIITIASLDSKTNNTSINSILSQVDLRLSVSATGIGFFVLTFLSLIPWKKSDFVGIGSSLGCLILSLFLKAITYLGNPAKENPYNAVSFAIFGLGIVSIIPFCISCCCVPCPCCPLAEDPVSKDSESFIQTHPIFNMLPKVNIMAPLFYLNFIGCEFTLATNWKQIPFTKYPEHFQTTLSNLSQLVSMANIGIVGIVGIIVFGIGYLNMGVYFKDGKKYKFVLNPWPPIVSCIITIAQFVVLFCYIPISDEVFNCLHGIMIAINFFFFVFKNRKEDTSTTLPDTKLK